LVHVARFGFCDEHISSSGATVGRLTPVAEHVAHATLLKTPGVYTLKVEGQRRSRVSSPRCLADAAAVTAKKVSGSRRQEQPALVRRQLLRDVKNRKYRSTKSILRCRHRFSSSSHGLSHRMSRTENASQGRYL
jgi:hypothetical protein